jgi:S1-C subfamily serine protease
MNSKFLLLAATILLATPLTHAAEGPLKEKALAIYKKYQDSVLFLSAVVELEVTAGDNPAKKEERKIEMLGTVLNKDGLIVVPNSTLDVASAVDGRMVNTQSGPVKLSAKATTKEVKILLPDGTEIPAKVSFKDADLDLAFIRPEKPEEAKLTPIDSANSGPLTLLDDVIVIGRLGKDLNREAVAITSEVIAIITKPRTYARIGAQSLGMPVFTQDGKFAGIGINRFSPKGDTETQGAPPTNVILPAADILESAAQAK